MSTDPRDFMVVYVDGPMNGFVEEGVNSLALLRNLNGQEIGRRVRSSMPWYAKEAMESGIDRDRLFQLHEKAGVKPWGDPVYELQETEDPQLYKYVYIGEYDALKGQEVVSESGPRLAAFQEEKP